MSALPDGHSPTEALLDRVAAFVEQHGGLVLEGAHRAGLRSALRGRLRSLQCADEAEYLRLLRDFSTGELARLVDLVTIPETRFFRNPAHFRVLREVILPGLLRAPREVCLWSAGCSTGEEAYGLAIACLEAGLPGVGCPVTVVGTDISHRSLAAAAQGEYASRQLAGMEHALRERYFERVDDRWRVVPRVRALVSWKHHNLVSAELPVAAGSADVVFCQNVTIYFRPEVTREVSRRLALALRPGGYLFPGFSETLWQTAPGLVTAGFGDCFLYRKDGPGVARGEGEKGRRGEGETGRAARAPRAQPTQPSLTTHHSPLTTHDSPPTTHSVTAAGHLEKARQEAFAGNLEPAVESAGRAVAMDPLLVEGWELLGLLHRQAGRPGEAERALRRQFYLQPDSPMVHFHLAGLFRESGRTDDARREYANAARLLAALPPETVLGGVTADLLLRACRQYAAGKDAGG